MYATMAMGGVEVVMDELLDDSLPSDDDVGALTITMIPEGSSRGSDKIIDNLGCAYTIKKKYVSPVNNFDT